jgi:hypothetical protein
MVCMNFSQELRIWWEKEEGKLPDCLYKYSDFFLDASARSCLIDYFICPGYNSQLYNKYHSF